MAAPSCCWSIFNTAAWELPNSERAPQLRRLPSAQTPTAPCQQLLSAEVMGAQDAWGRSSAQLQLLSRAGRRAKHGLACMHLCVCVCVCVCVLGVEGHMHTGS